MLRNKPTKFYRGYPRLFLLALLFQSVFLLTPVGRVFGQAVAIADSIRPKSPLWLDNAVFYEIYPQTFYDSNADGVGDLPGIIKKLPYVKSLGVKAIWLNPIYTSPFRDAGYDVSDYYHVAPRYGTNADAKMLFQKAHEIGLKVIIDYVPGHTSIEHPWFKQSALPTPNKYTNWYIWTNGTYAYYDKSKFTFIQGYSDRDGNYLPNYFWHQPALNYGFDKPDPKQPWQLPVDHPDVLALKAEMWNVMKYWLDMGCDGFRVDMAGSLIKEDESGACGRYWNQIRERINKLYPEAILISEWSYPKAAVPAGFHADFIHWSPSFQDLYKYFRPDGKGNLTDFMSFYLDQYNSVKEKGYVSLTMANHDLPRLRTPERDAKDLEIIYAFELTMPGIPFMYYGDEIGMKQLTGLPATEGSYGTRAGARTPMQWTNGPNDGFSLAERNKLYRAVDTSFDAPAVSAQINDPNSLLSKTKKLIELRSTLPALKSYAGFQVLQLRKDGYPFIYARKLRQQQIIVVLNPADQPTEATISIQHVKSAKRVAGDIPFKQSGDTFLFKIPGRSYGIYCLESRERL